MNFYTGLEWFILGFTCPAGGAICSGVIPDWNWDLLVHTGSYWSILVSPCPAGGAPCPGTLSHGFGAGGQSRRGHLLEPAETRAGSAGRGLVRTGFYHLYWFILVSTIYTGSYWSILVPRVPSELSFVAQCLGVNPKSYGAWHHRGWVLGHTPAPPAGREDLALCERLLAADSRNCEWFIVVCTGLYWDGVLRVLGVTGLY